MCTNYPTDTIRQTYQIHDVAAYINWIYFFHAWGFQPRFAAIADIHGCDVCRASWLTTFSKEDMPKATEAMQLFKEANRMIDLLDRDYRTYAQVRLCPAYALDDDIVIGKTRFPFLRQQTITSNADVLLCLSDFIKPKELADRDPKGSVANTIGVFAATVDAEMEQLYENDPYKQLLVKTLSDRLAEATTERMHEQVRKEWWGYAKNEQLSVHDLLYDKFQGIRPAVGYPSMPDQSVNFLINELIDMSKIGINLTENGAMRPHASVSGLIFAHPAARYFSIGKIGEDQLADYARRREKSSDEIKKFLAANL